LARTILDPQDDVGRELDVREWGHQYLYTRSDLADKLKVAGFSAIIETKPNDFANKIFRVAQGHGRLLGYELNDLNAFALEAIK